MTKPIRCPPVHVGISGVSYSTTFRTLSEADAFCRLDGEFVKTVQQRGAAIIKARKFSSALSAASSVCDHVRNWIKGTPEVRLSC